VDDRHDGQVGLARRRLDLIVAKQLARLRQPFAQGEAGRGEGVPQIVNTTSGARPACGCGATAAACRSNTHRVLLVM
jgi:hypothetical protein